MSNNTMNDKTVSMEAIEKINAVEGFDPTPFVVDYSDLNSGQSRKRLPVMIQIAWFRMKHPEGKIMVHVEPRNDCFAATARIYANYKDPVDCFLAEASVSRAYCTDKPSVSPREWAQTAAIGKALLYAGFGLQFSLAGEDFPDLAPNELEPGEPKELQTGSEPNIDAPRAAEPDQSEEPPELTLEEKYEKAIQVPCPIQKFGGKTLGEVLVLEPKALKWVATKFTGDPEIKAAAQTICDYAVTQASA